MLFIRAFHETLANSWSRLCRHLPTESDEKASSPFIGLIAVSSITSRLLSLWHKVSKLIEATVPETLDNFAGFGQKDSKLKTLM
jgi:hypothetical protein